MIKTAAILIIGDEILNGKIIDTNSRFFTSTLFAKGVEVKQIAVVGDDSRDICDAVLRLHARYDFVITSGGIGPTLDDITYESIATAFKLPLELHEETVNKMKLTKRSFKLEGDALKAQHRMAIFPQGKNVSKINLYDDLWVPVVSIDEKVFILPGVPQLFERLLIGLLKKYETQLPANTEKFVRFFVKTPLSESQISPHLDQLDKQAQGHRDVKIGSYPHMGLGFNTVSIIGRARDTEFLRTLVDQSIKEVQGVEITEAQELEYSSNVDEIKEQNDWIAAS